MGLSRTWCQSGEFVVECEKMFVIAQCLINMRNKCMKWHVISSSKIQFVHPVTTVNLGVVYLTILNNYKI